MFLRAIRGPASVWPRTYLPRKPTCSLPVRTLLYYVDLLGYGDASVKFLMKDVFFVHHHGLLYLWNNCVAERSLCITWYYVIYLLSPHVHEVVCTWIPTRFYDFVRPPPLAQAEVAGPSLSLWWQRPCVMFCTVWWWLCRLCICQAMCHWPRPLSSQLGWLLHTVKFDFSIL